MQVSVVYSSFSFQFSSSPHLLSSRSTTLPLLPCFQSSTYLSLALLYLDTQCRGHIIGVGVFFLESVVVVVVKVAGRLWGRGLYSFYSYSFNHFYFSLSLPSSSMFKKGACNWVVGFCFGKEGDCCNQGCWLAFQRKGRVIFFSPSCIYIPHKCEGSVWVVGYPCCYPYFGSSQAGLILHNLHLGQAGSIPSLFPQSRSACYL